MQRNVLTVAFYLGAVPALALCILLHFYPPQQLHLPPCLFHEITGLYCPGCGSARALHHLMNFEIIQAMQCNLFFVFLAPFLLYIFLQKLTESLGIKPLPMLTLTPQVGRTLAVLILLWWFLRNLPFDIFKIPD